MLTKNTPLVLFCTLISTTSLFSVKTQEVGEILKAIAHEFFESAGVKSAIRKVKITDESCCINYVSSPNPYTSDLALFQASMTQDHPTQVDLNACHPKSKDSDVFMQLHLENYPQSIRLDTGRIYYDEKNETLITSIAIAFAQRIGAQKLEATRLHTIFRRNIAGESFSSALTQRIQAWKEVGFKADKDGNFELNLRSESASSILKNLSTIFALCWLPHNFDKDKAKSV